MLDLCYQTPPQWLDAVFSDFDSFLVDHAACERKASATGMNFVVRYPDRPELVEPLIEFAREELEHFQIVYEIGWPLSLPIWRGYFRSNSSSMCNASANQ